MSDHQAVALFTDGSAWTGDRIGGWAWFALWEEDKESQDNGWATDTTSQRMELMAWIHGLNAIERELGSCHVLVYSDSEYVGLGAMDKSRARRKNKDLWPILDFSIEKHVEVEFIHVKGHRDSLYNNLVDRLAGEARKEGQRGLLPAA